MKAFIFVALVASVAARSLDLDTLRLVKEKSLLNRPVVDDVLLKEKLINQLPLDKTVVGDVVRDTVLPVQDKTVLRTDLTEGLRGIYDDVDRVLTIDELYTTQLFREYLRLPVFRQYIQYPSFQRYVASVYFQRFWQVPTFKQYFYNPVLFYKYIYPIVQLFQNEYTLPINNIYGQEDVYGYQGLEDVYRNRNVFPYAYNNRYQGLPTSYITGQELYNTYGTTNYKFLLDKVYKTLFNNQPIVGDVTQVKTDVKILPGDNKVVVEPITGERHVVVDQPKIVDVKVDQKIVPVERVTPVVDTIVPVEKDQDVLITDRDVLLLKVLLKERVITPEIYQQVIRGQVPLITVLRQIYGQHIDINDVVRQIVNRRDVFDNVAPFEKRIVDDVLVNDQREILLNDREILLVKYLLRENVITPEIYEAVIRGQIQLTTVLREIFGQHVDINQVIRQIINRRDVYDNIYNYPTVNRFNTQRFDRVNLFNRFNKYNNYYNTEIPTLRENTFERLPLQKVLENIVA